MQSVYSRFGVIVSAVLGAVILLVSPRWGIAQTVFDLAWSGAPFGNNATATGTITLNLADINNPGQTSQNLTPFVTDFSITVTGASSGNGTFGFSDYNGATDEGGFYIITGGTLDFTHQLVGQATPGGPWGSTHDGNTGDFNIFTNGNDPAAPLGTFFFITTSGDGNGDNMYLTSFTPAPEPASLGILGLGGLSLLVRRRPKLV
jgi:hypothetical protein